MIRARMIAALAAAATVCAGLAARTFLGGLLAKVLGVALWATLVYVLVLFVAPRMAIRRAAVIALCVSFAVELAQLTPGPAWLSAKNVVLRMIFGTTFSAWDLPMYCGGVALAVAVHAMGRAFSGPAGDRRPDRPTPG